MGTQEERGRLASDAVFTSHGDHDESISKWFPGKLGE